MGPEASITTLNRCFLSGEPVVRDSDHDDLVDNGAGSAGDRWWWN